MKKLLLLLSLFIAASSYAQNVPVYVPTNGLVGWWPFNGNANDESGNGNNGINNGATLTIDRNGNLNSAYYFSSAGCATRIDIANFNYGGPVNSFSMSFWMLRIGNGCISPRLFEFGNGSGWGVNWINGQSTMDWVVNNTLQDNVWYHVVYVIQSGNINSYINGVFDSQYSLSNPGFGSNVCFGRMNHPAYDAFNGKLDDIGIWNRALTPCEIQALYTGMPSTFNTNLITQDTIKACGDSVLVAATSGLSSYSWNTGATTSSIFAKNTGWYKVTGANAQGCTATDSVFVSILKANILNNDTTVCLGASLTLNAQQAASGTSCTKSGLATNLQNGLVGYWPFCGNANDMSGNNRNGLVTNAQLNNDRFGNSSSCYAFNPNTNSRIIFTNSNYTVSNNFTYSVWVNPSNSFPNGSILLPTQGQTGSEGNPTLNNCVIHPIHGSNFGSISTSVGSGLYVGNNGLFVSEHTHLYISAPITYAANLNGWHLITIVYSNKVPNLYIDGNYIKSGTPNPRNVFLSLGQDLTTFANYIQAGVGSSFANSSSSSNNYFNGKLDDILMYNRALSASEVAQLYQASAYATTYLWSTGATTASINVTPTQTTKYWLQVSNGISTCTDTVTITVQNPTAPAVSNVSYCQGATASALTATESAGNSLLWYSTATGGTGSSTAPTPSTTTVGTTTYYVSQITTPQGCESVRASITVTVNALPQASITASKTPIICTGDSVVFSVSPQVAGQSYVWYKDGVIINGATNTSYAAKQSGAYSVRVTNSNGCSITSASSTLNVYPWPTVNAGPDKEVPAGTSVDIITQTTNAQSIAWSPVTGLSCINCASPTATVNFPIVYIVTVTSAGGCSVSDTVSIQLVCEEDLLYMPNTFTPNGDGENDRFYPMGKGLGEVTVFRIVNRLGQVVYTRSRFAINNASYGWDGTFNGADLGMDVYSYYIEVPCATGQIIKKTGDISLLR